MRRRVALVFEILAAYRRARRVLTHPLPEAVARQRSAEHSVTAHLEHAGAEGRRLGRAIQLVLRPLPVDDRCLVRSLTLVRLLAARGLSGTVVIGVRNRPEFAAHAWVELDGVALLPDGGGEFTRLVEA